MTNVLVARGRPRNFDIEMALNVGQRLIHERGYEAVGIAALTEALDIKPPSFYKAFGSKSDYFARILERYAASVLALEHILIPGRPPAEALEDLLERAARAYSHNPLVRGCLVLEAARGGSDEESAILARRTAVNKRNQIRSFITASHPKVAEGVTDYVASTMSGLSASAREGMSKARLVTVAHAAAAGLRTILTKDQAMKLKKGR